MISKDTALKIYNCHNEIEKANKLISDMKEVLASTGSPKLKDAFGDRKGLQLGVPSGEGSHRIFDVPIDLSILIIQGHIETQNQRLKELMAFVKIEMHGD